MSHHWRIRLKFRTPDVSTNKTINLEGDLQDVMKRISDECPNRDVPPVFVSFRHVDDEYEDEDYD